MRVPGKNLKLRTKVIFGGFAVIIIALVFLIKALNGPATGTITNTPEAVVPSVSTLTATGKTFSFEYLSSFHQIKNDVLGPLDVEKLSLTNPQTNPWHLDITIRKLPSGNLSDDGSYNLRKLNSQTYSEQTVTYRDNTFYIMTDGTGGYSKVAFLLNKAKGLDANISMTSASVSDTSKIDQAYTQVLSTWKWL